MKQKILIIMAFLFVSLSINAKNTSNYSYFRPIEFVEQGIKFTVFQNGTFEFNFEYNATVRNYNNRCNRNVIRDRYGKVRRVGTVLINYDRYNRLSRIGNINVGFNNRCISNVGGLYIRYDGFGSFFYSGSVNRIHPRNNHYYKNPQRGKFNKKQRKSKMKSNKRYKKSRRA